MRESWDQYFMRVAKLVATRATCDRKHVGAVIVRNNRILSTGYNGSLPGEPHCDDVGHLMRDGHCERTVHAEANAIAHAAKYGISLKDSTLYVTASPCLTCFKLAVSAGVTRIVYEEFYRDHLIEEMKPDYVTLEKLK
jgi:dCMP deaminase